MFPSWLYHHVEANNSDLTRTSISFQYLQGSLLTRSLYTWYDFIKLTEFSWQKDLKCRLAPTAPVDDFDIELCKKEIQGKKIVFCLPWIRGCSYTFLKNFVQLCFDLVQSGASIQISQDYSSMVNFARCKVLGANVLRGKNQIPWDGKLEYDYQLWIDNDIVFSTESFYRLFQLGLEKEIAMVGMQPKMA